ncbi:hypothetical protein [uncultured Bacteroides sp.]|uniref:hypothetical protein n=1 Tax=uncultured Bacteroides sp. TaxID=162156 RepID=UPI002AAB10FC|nr:hypothetical protein [uncultured Bacteroides sp.]
MEEKNMQEPIIPDEEMLLFANSSLSYANSYLSTLEKNLSKKEHFNNDLLYNIAVMAFEKYFVSLLARYNWAATHHMPVALYREAEQFDNELTESMKATSILVGKFERICSLDDFGYRTPEIEEIHSMVEGMKEIKKLVEKRMSEVNEIS